MPPQPRSMPFRLARHANAHHGFTLIELLLAVSIFILLATLSATLLGSVLKTYASDKLTQDLQREADAVLAHMSTNLRVATVYDSANSNLATNPNSLAVKLSTNQGRRYYVTGSQLHYVNESGADENLLQPGTTVTSLIFEPTSENTALKSVKIRATLRRAKGGAVVTSDVGSTVGTRPQ